MTDTSDADQGRAVAAKWCSLAEQRLDYLTELFETGRWRRFYSETQFLENVREAKANVEHWRTLSLGLSDVPDGAAAADGMPAKAIVVGGPGQIRLDSTAQPASKAESLIAPAGLPATPSATLDRIEDRYPQLSNEF